MKKVFESKRSRTIGVLAILAIVIAVYMLIPKHNVFINTRNMNIARAEHQAVLLKDGRVLILGGGKGLNAEIYNPEKRKFTLIEGPKKLSLYFSMTGLDNGKVLIVGPFKTVDLFDPEANTFSEGSILNYPRHQHTATLLKDGRVLIAGGRVFNSNKLVDTPEIFNPKTNKFEIGPKMNFPRYEHNAILLNNGNVLIVGGGNNTGAIDIAELFDSKNNKFIKLQKANYERFKPQLIKLNDNKVLIIGGFSADRWDEMIEIFDPKANQFSKFILNELVPPTSKALLLKNGNILFTAGSKRKNWYSVPTKESAILNVTKKELIKGPDLKQKRCLHSVTLLNDGKVLVIGGNLANQGSVALKSTELYIP
jgi:hypothetical protein